MLPRSCWSTTRPVRYEGELSVLESSSNPYLELVLQHQSENGRPAEMVGTTRIKMQDGRFWVHRPQRLSASAGAP